MMFKVGLLLFVFTLGAVPYVAQSSDVKETCRQLFERKSYTDALKVCEQESKVGNSESRFLFAMIYLNGMGVEKDVQRAISVLRGLSESRYFPASNALGFVLQNDDGFRDLSKAYHYFMTAAQGGYAEAQFNLAITYMRGLGVQKNMEQAVYWLKKSAKQDYPDALYDLGRLYLIGEGVGKDFSYALELLEKAAGNGQSGAQYYLGYFYYTGNGVEKDDKKAAELILESANNGHPEANYQFSLFLIKGVAGLPKDIKEAYLFAVLSKQLGYDKAKNLVSKIEQSVRADDLEKMKLYVQEKLYSKRKI